MGNVYFATTFKKQLLILVTFLTTGKYVVFHNYLNLEKTWNNWTLKDLPCFVLLEESELGRRYRNTSFNFPQLINRITCQPHRGHFKTK